MMAEMIGHHGYAKKKMWGFRPQASMIGMIILGMGSALVALVIVAGLMAGVPMVVAMAFGGMRRRGGGGLTAC